MVVYVCALAATWPTQQVALRSFPPLLLTGTRCLISGLVLMLVFRPRHWRSKFRQFLGWATLSSVFNVILLFTFTVLAIRDLSAGVASLLVYTWPLLFAILSHRVLNERLRPRDLAALGLGVAGIAAITAPGGAARTSVQGVVFGCLAALSWGIGATYLRYVGRRGWVDPSRLIGPQFLIGGLVITAFGSEFERWSQIQLNVEGWTSAVLLTVGALVGWFAYGWLLNREVPARTISAWSLCIPLVANLFGITALNQSWNAWLLVGAAAMAVSLVTVQSGRSHSVEESTTGGNGLGETSRK